MNGFQYCGTAVNKPCWIDANFHPAIWLPFAAVDSNVNLALSPIKRCRLAEG